MMGQTKLPQSDVTESPADVSSPWGGERGPPIPSVTRGVVLAQLYVLIFFYFIIPLTLV